MNTNLFAGIKRIYQAQLEYQLSRDLPDMNEIRKLQALIQLYS